MSLVVFAPNWLGDAVMALPALADLCRLQGGTGVAVAARPAVAGLFELAPGVEAVVRLAHPSDGNLWHRFATDVERVRRVGARRAVLLPNSARAALVAWRAGVPERCGYRRDLRGPLLTYGVARPRGRVHQVDSYRHLAAAIGAEPGPREPSLDVPPEVRGRAARLLEHAGWDGASPLLGVAPGAAYGGAKCWPAERYARTLAALAHDRGLTSVIVGSAADQVIACTVSREAGKIIGTAGRCAVIDLAGRTDLQDLAGVMAHCSAFLSNDSGATHLAAAIGLPVVAVFGPTDERVTAPLGRVSGGVHRPVRAVVGRAWCRPCGLRECPIDHRCMVRVSVDQVVGAVKDVS
ncbi:MAG: lipopolysaccharide heptosyltransferase II [Acidobacteriota bacterium]